MSCTPFINQVIHKDYTLPQFWNLLKLVLDTQINILEFCIIHHVVQSFCTTIRVGNPKYLHCFYLNTANLNYKILNPLMLYYFLHSKEYRVPPLSNLEYPNFQPVAKRWYFLVHFLGLILNNF
ncbi:EC1118_1N9_1783p [Saccharomyces cerevisiae EC1118]|uniref:Putative uncharacterized protein YNL171C n=2 Tax=Saccharomyces cerevisiae TaxID=4932 RepID=YNR1_YEAST|nr:RecName: Full=Putative uncharacterized protein YNL171C [Saccharomyces cerevisiae S288C]CAA96061.1 unnamed protein product [Saccharomyces cerevisiae]CAY82430.1 EC1118_1N9_1783p [Saccharomyces cerevisiae EC1118]